MTPQEQQVWDWFTSSLTDKSVEESLDKHVFETLKPVAPDFKCLKWILLVSICTYFLIIVSVLTYVFLHSFAADGNSSFCNNSCLLLVVLMLLATFAFVAVVYAVFKYRQSVQDDYNRKFAEFNKAFSKWSDMRYGLSTKMLEGILSGIGEKIKKSGIK